MAVRKIGMNCRSITGRQGLTGQQFESALERDLLDLLKFDLRIEYYETQPLTLYYEAESKKVLPYTPDVLVHYHQQPSMAEALCPLLVEVKYRDEYRERYCEFRPRFRAAHRYAKERGWKFRVMTEREIRTPYLDNARFLRPYRDHRSDQIREKLILDKLRAESVTTLNALVTSLSDHQKERAELLTSFWKLVADFRIGADLMQKLEMSSRIWWQSEA